MFMTDVGSEIKIFFYHLYGAKNAQEWLKKWRSREGYEKFVRAVQQFIDVDFDNVICKQNYVKALVGAENIQNFQKKS